MNKQIYKKFIENKEREYLHDAIKDSVLTYAEMFEKAAGIANFLYEHGISKGSRVAIMLSNSVEFIGLYFANIFLGAVAIPFTPNYASDELAYVIQKIQPDIVLAPDSIINSKVTREIKDGYNIVSTDACCLEELKAEKLNFELPDIDWDDVAGILFTSGTTGNPKGVGMKYGAVHENLSIYGTDMKFGAQTRFMQIVPLYHAHGWLYSTIVPALFGCSVILNEPFNVLLCAKFWERVEKYKGTALVGVPSILTALLEMSKRYDEIPTGLLECVICGSSFLHTNLKNTFESTFKTKIYEWYGATETIYLAYHSPDRKFKPGTVGKIFPRDVEIRIADTTEVCVKTKYFFKGYMNDEELTKATYDEDGWYHTGDTGSIDEEGYVSLSGRVKNIINKGGYKVSPVQINNCLVEYDGIIDAGTIGVPDEMYGEEIYSFVSVRHNGNFDEKAVLRYCKEKLSQTICPKRILVIPAIPRNPMGKIDKFRLAEIYNDMHEK